MLAAVAIGNYFGVPDKAIIEAIEAYVPSNSRSQLMEKGNNTIILDAYNANPSSMRLAIENFAQKEGSQKVLLLGAMAELGEKSMEEHQEIVTLIQQFSWHKVVLVGGDFYKLQHPYLQMNTAAEAMQWLKEQHYSNTQFLIKGSRSQRMEQVLEAFD
jgi:UDP-N-acetylmuramoyl-tripeptide--D-alanyl-D-alanine ligase